MAGFENNVVAGSRFEIVGSVIALPNRQKPCQTSETTFTCFGDPNAPLGPKKPKKPSQEQPKLESSFRKWVERG